MMALKHMSGLVENQIRLLMSYYGESPDSSEAPKPEDFFALIASFSSSLQVSLWVLRVGLALAYNEHYRNALLRYTKQSKKPRNYHLRQ